MTFDEWWHYFGSGVRRGKREDSEEFARRISKYAWDDCIRSSKRAIEGLGSHNENIQNKTNV